MNKKYIYLAIPYTFNPELSFEIINKVAAELIKSHIVFSPISHTHPIGLEMPEEYLTDSDFWLEQDLAIMERFADELWIVTINDLDGVKLIDESKGVQREIKCALENSIPIRYIGYNYSESILALALATHLP